MRVGAQGRPRVDQVAGEALEQVRRLGGQLQVAQLGRRLSERHLDLELTDEARAHVARVGYDPDFGARPLKRVLQREVADPIALKLLQGEFRDGDAIVVDASPDGLVFTKREPQPATV